MNKKLFSEMENNLKMFIKEKDLSEMRIFLFGHCAATLELIDLLEKYGLKTAAILDNSDAKQGIVYRDAKVVYPNEILQLTGEDSDKNSIVLITSRFYASMQKQLRELGYDGPIRKLIDYNTYADYSLSEETITRMKAREQHGEELIKALNVKYDFPFKVFCPFNALGDIYYMISYWEAFAKVRNISNVVFCVPGRSLIEVIRMFGDYQVEVYEQKELDSMIQAALYTNDKESFIAHQDRPYVVNLFKALYVKLIPLKQIYCCGVYGLPYDTVQSNPINTKEYKELDRIVRSKSVILSPYAKSVTSIGSDIWNEIVNYYTSQGYKCYTNVFGDEMALDGTEPISPALSEMNSVVEKAGLFIGIRSGLCDVLTETKARKIALYPDYFYCDTKWKAIDMYSIDTFENYVVMEGDTWESIMKRM